jgi:hypothetical protein
MALLWRNRNAFIVQSSGILSKTIGLTVLEVEAEKASKS